MLPSRLRSAPALAALAMTVATAQATTVERLSLPELVGRAQSIFVGTCTAVAEQTIDGKPYQLYCFRVAETLKGAPAALARCHLPGGRLADSRAGARATYGGMPRFAVGEEAVVFLSRPDATGYPWPMGLGQGCFRILRDPESGISRVRQLLDGLHLVDPNAAKTAGAAGQPSAALDDFLQAVRTLAGSPTPAPRAR